MGDFHQFDIDVAAEVGVNAAVIYNAIRYWCKKNYVNGRNIHDGLAYTYNSVRGWAKLYPYLSQKQIRLALSKLEDSGRIVSGVYNKMPNDRTKWYAIASQFVDWDNSICDSGQTDLPNQANDICPEGPAFTSSKPVPKPDREEKRKRFTPPSPIEVAKYCKESGHYVDPDAFIDFYESKGWLVGSTKMKDWKAAVRTWEKRQSEAQKADAIAAVKAIIKANTPRQTVTGDWYLGDTKIDPPEGSQPPSEPVAYVAPVPAPAPRRKGGTKSASDLFGGMFA